MARGRGEADVSGAPVSFEGILDAVHSSDCFQGR